MSAKIDPMNSRIEPITTAPAAFTGIVEKVNEIIEGNPPLKAGVGIEITDSKNHRLISVLPASLPTPTSPPFTLSFVGTVGTFTPGTVNGLLPALTITVSATGTRYIILRTTWSTGNLNGASWIDSASAPDSSPLTQTTPPTSFDILTHIVVQGTPIRVIAETSLQVNPYEAFRIDKTPPLIAGERPWISYYGYQVVSSA
jgi:hypothetical protein